MAAFSTLPASDPRMKTHLLCAAALTLAGCAVPTISTELDPAGSPRYRGTSTGTNIARHADPQALIKAGQKTIDREDLDRMLRSGGPAAKGAGG
jgi:hypothetical protein